VALDDMYYYAHKDGGFCIMAHGGGGADAEYEVSGPPLCVGCNSTLHTVKH
jgi:hypothetical protein